MATPTTREQFKNYCLRRLGAPVININVDPEQVEDRIDDALKYWNDYHYDGTQKIYLKHQVTANNRAGSIYSLTIDAAGTGYTNSDTITISGGSADNAATGSITTDANGSITSANLLTNGTGYFGSDPVVTINTSTGSSAEITAQVGGWIPISNNIIGVTDIFDVGGAFNTSSMFSVTYQFFLNDMYNLANAQLTNYYMAMTHIRVLEELLVGKIPLRYNRFGNRLYLDMNWEKFAINNYVIAVCYEIMDPTINPRIWSDRWLCQFATAMIKQQWGSNLTKFIGGTLPGGLQFNGQKILDDATNEIEHLKQRMAYDSSGLPEDFIG